MNGGTPAQKAMEYYCSAEECKQKGRAHTTLPVLLFKEFHAYKQSQKKSSYRQKNDVALRDLRKLANDRKGWKKVVKQVCIACNEDPTYELSDSDGAQI